MADTKELNRLLSQVKFHSQGNYVDGLGAFRDLLENDPKKKTLNFLLKWIEKVNDEERSGLAFVIAEHYLQTANLKDLQTLFASGDACIKAGLLNGLTSNPGNNPHMGPGIIALAVEGAAHSAAEVRGWACIVFQNQAGWKVDITDAVDPLLTLLNDPEHSVRHSAIYATGNLCSKRKLNWTPHLKSLQKLLRDKDIYIPEAAAWALARMSQAKQDISPAIPNLIRMLTDRQEYNEPRKKAIRAILHHAKKSQQNLDQVRTAVKKVSLDKHLKEINKFLVELAKL